MNANPRLRHTPSASGGFTLVEILMVIAIIGILVAIAIPGIGMAISRTKTVKMRLEAGALEDAIEKYEQKYGDYPPDFSDWIVIERHYNKIFPRIAQSEINRLRLFTDRDPSNDTLLDAAVPATWPSGAAWAHDAAKLDRGEVLAWVLGGYSENAIFPFTGPGGPLELVEVDASTAWYQMNSDRPNKLYDFAYERLDFSTINSGAPVSRSNRYLSSDGDLFPTYSAVDGAPFVYFDNRTYAYFDPYLGFNGYASTAFGAVRPYFSDQAQANPSGADYGSLSNALRAWKFVKPDSFQIIAPGVDKAFGTVAFYEVDSSSSGAEPVYFQYPTGRAIAPSGDSGINLPGELLIPGITGIKNEQHRLAPPKTSNSTTCRTFPKHPSWMTFPAGSSNSVTSPMIFDPRQDEPMIPIRSKNAFTLVEVLTVLTILSLMAGLIITSVSGVTRAARESRTRNIIAAVDSVLAEQYESYKYRSFAVEIPDMFQSTNLTSGSTTSEIGFEVLATEMARVRLMMVRDLQRMEMPDRLSDITDAPQELRAAANPVLRNNSTNQIINTRADKSQRRMFPVSWYDSSADYASRRDNVPSKLSAYRDRIRSVASLSGGTFNFTAAASLQNQGAECLYLIMATSYVGGAPAIRVIPTTNIADTDGDGLLEILDGWGQPLGFVRWPVGYFDPELSINTTVPDDFDLFRADYAYIVDPSTSTVAIPTDVNAVPQVKTQPWSMRPLVFSYGSNKAPGMATNPWTATGAEDADFSYQDSLWNWGVNANNYGVQEVQGRTRGIGSITYSSHPFPDPYLRAFVESNQISGAFGGLLPGQQFTIPSALEDVSDNITNYQLQATAK